MGKTPATFDYREIGPHDTGDRRCSCGELTICATRHAALVAAARAVVKAWGPSGGPEWDWMNRRVDALRAALDGEPE